MIRVNSCTSTNIPRLIAIVFFTVWFAAASAGFAHASGTWTATGGLNFPRAGHTATLLADGQVLVAGGEDSSGNLVASAELYNPASGTWTVSGRMLTTRQDHTATLLANGEVLVAGGISGGAATASAELYNPSTGEWTATRSMTMPRAFAAAALLGNGQVLMAGGTNADGTSNTTAELYNPATGEWTTTTSMPSSHASPATRLLNGESAGLRRRGCALRSFHRPVELDRSVVLQWRHQQHSRTASHRRRADVWKQIFLLRRSALQPIEQYLDADPGSVWQWSHLGSAGVAGHRQGSPRRRPDHVQRSYIAHYTMRVIRSVYKYLDAYGCAATGCTSYRDSASERQSLVRGGQRRRTLHALAHKRLNSRTPGTPPRRIGGRPPSGQPARFQRDGTTTARARRLGIRVRAIRCASRCRVWASALGLCVEGIQVPRRFIVSRSMETLSVPFDVWAAFAFCLFFSSAAAG